MDDFWVNTAKNHEAKKPKDSTDGVSPQQNWLPQPKPSDTCPNCGYCPHCGRGGQWTSPYQTITWRPGWYDPYITWC